MKRFSFYFFACSICFFSILPVYAGNPDSAYYSEESDRLFWFLQIADIHVGASTSSQTNLTWLVNEAVDVIDPSFIVACGDLTDSTDGGLIPDGPYISEWETYIYIVSEAGMTSDFYFDIPGNHDHYNDENFSYYLNNSIQGKASGNTQVSWRRDFDFGSYHFLGINTAGNDGAGFSLLHPFGDNAGLDASELLFIEDELAKHADADLSLIFGHHPLPQRSTGENTDTYLSYGAGEFIDLMERYGVSMYSYGHTHQYRQGLLSTTNSPGVFDLNIAPLGKEPKGSPYSYQLTAIDCNGISTVQQPVNTWPAVLITAPVDAKLGVSANPYAYSVNDLNPKPIRALVFDKDPITAVHFRIDNGAWQEMIRKDPDGPLWTAFWNEPDDLDKEHLLEVRASGTSTRSHVITVGITDTSIEKSDSGGGGCFIGSVQVWFTKKK
jgi:hypothetical protein